MHNTGRALATQWDTLLGYYCPTRGWHWKTADDVGRMPAGHLVSSQLRVFLEGWGGGKALSTMHPPPPPPIHFCSLIADLSGYATWGQMPGQVLWAATTTHKKLRQTDNPQVGLVYPKVKEQTQGQTVCFPFKARLMSEHGGTTIGSEWRSQITVLWRVSDGTARPISFVFMPYTPGRLSQY